MSVTLSGCCCFNFWRRDENAYNEMDAERNSAAGSARCQRPVLLFRCLGVCQLGLGVGLLVCGLVIVILQTGWYSWGSLLMGLLELASGILCLLATCRKFHTEEMAYKRFASCQLRIHFGISMFILTGLSISAPVTTGVGGFVGSCYGTEDDCKNYTYVRNATIVSIVLMLLSIIAAVVFIYLSCVIGEVFGMGYNIHTEGGVTNIATIGADEVHARQEARGNQAQTARQVQEGNLAYGQQNLGAGHLIAEQGQLPYEFDNPAMIRENDDRRGRQRQQLQEQHEQLVQHWITSNQQPQQHQDECLPAPQTPNATARRTTYDIVLDVQAEVATLTSLIAEAHEQVVDVDRHNIVDDVLNIYTDPDILRTRIKVQFKGELGDDFSGLTKDMFTQFWKKAKDDCFTGCDAMVPNLPMHRDPDIIMAAIGRVISHLLMLRGRVPYAFCRSSLLAAAAPDSVISQSLLLEDFLLYSEADDKTILQKVIDNTEALTDDDLGKLIDLFSKYGQRVRPRKDIIREQIATIARAEFCNKPMYLLRPMRTGLGMPGRLAAFWDTMNEEKIRVLFACDIPTADGVIACLMVHRSLRNREQFSLDLLKMFLKDTESTLLTPFLTMVTGSADLPDEGINVTFNDTSGAGRRPCFHTCGNVLELSMNYLEYDEFKREMEEVLTDPAYLEMGLR